MEQAYPAPTFPTNSPTLQTQQCPIAAVSTSPTDSRPDYGCEFEGLQTPPESSYIMRSMEEHKEKDHVLTDENEKTDAGVIDLVTDGILVVTPPRSDSNDHRSQSKERSPSQVTRGNVRMSQSTNSTQSARPHLSDNSLSDAPYVSSINVADEQQEHYGLDVDASYSIVDLTFCPTLNGLKIVVGKLQFDKPTTHLNISTLEPNLLGTRSQVVHMSKISLSSWLLVGYQHDDTSQESYAHGNLGVVRSNTKDVVRSNTSRQYQTDDTSGGYQSKDNEDIPEDYDVDSEEAMHDRVWSKWEDKCLLSCMAEGKKLSKMDTILDRSLDEIEKRWATIRQDEHKNRKRTLTGTRTAKNSRVSKRAKPRKKNQCTMCGGVGHNIQTCGK
jgi:hypothetical protein